MLFDQLVIKDIQMSHLTLTLFNIGILVMGSVAYYGMDDLHDT